jgi:hypothetical protein
VPQKLLSWEARAMATKIVMKRGRWISGGMIVHDGGGPRPFQVLF